jgi:putative hemolysin
MLSKFISMFGLSILLLLASCASLSSEKSEGKRRAGLANPAAARCLRDGYRLEFIYSPNGVPLQGLCVNAVAQAKCEEWAYFRGECRLDKASPTPPPSLPLELEQEEFPDLPKVRKIRINYG